jgi:TolA-binding protein
MKTPLRALDGRCLNTACFGRSHREPQGASRGFCVGKRNPDSPAASALPLWTLVVVLAVAVLTSASSASAQDAKANALYKAGSELQNGGQPEFAVLEYEKLLKEYPKDSVASYAQHNLGYCRFRLKEYDKAIASFGKVIEDWPKFKLLDETYYFLGKAQAAKQQFPASAKSFAAITEAKFPKSKWVAPSLYDRGEALYNADKKNDALVVYAEFVKNHAKHKLYPDALYALGVTQQETGDQAGAAVTYATFLKDKPEHAYATEVQMRLGDAKYALQDYAGAAENFAAATAVKEFAYGDYATQRHGEALFALKDYAKAAPVFLSLTTNYKKSPYRTIAFLSAGKCLFLTKEDAKARGALSQVLSADGEMAAEAAHWVARIDLRGNKPAGALKVVDAILPKAEKSAFYVDLLMDRADALDAIPNRQADAIAIYYGIFEKHPEHKTAARALYNAAFAAQATEKYDEALKMSGEFLAKYEGHENEPNVKYVAAESNLMTGKYAEAEVLFTGMLKDYASHADRQLWILRCATSMHLDKKYEETIALLTPEVAKVKGADAAAEAQYLLGFSHYTLGDYKAAAASLAASLAAQPKWRKADETALWLARSQGRLKDYDGAVATAKKLVKDFPESKVLDQAHYWMAEHSYQKDDYKTAIAQYQTVIDDWPNSNAVPYALSGLGLSHSISGDPAAAEKSFSTLIEKHAKHKITPRAYRFRAKSRQLLKNYAGAIVDAQKFLADNPAAEKYEKSATRHVLGFSLDQTKKHAEAAKTFETLLKDDPEYAEAARAIYDWAFALKEVDEAAANDIFARLVKEHPQHQLVFDAQYRVGQYYYDQAKAQQIAKKDGWKDIYAKAAEQYAAAKAKAGKDPLAEHVNYMLGLSSFQMGKHSAAAEAFADQLAAFPKGKLAADGKFMIAECLFKQKDYPKAMPAFEKSLAQLPSNKKNHPLALLHAGQTATKVELFARAAEILTKAAEDFPKSDLLPEIIYETGWAKHNLATAKGKKPDQQLLDEAMALYGQVNDTGEVGARAQFMMAEVYLVRKDYTKAFLGYNRVVAGFGKSKVQADALYQRAHCSDLLKKPDDANKSYLQLLKEHPESDKVAKVKTLLTQRGIKLPKE